MLAQLKETNFEDNRSASYRVAETIKKDLENFFQLTKFDVSYTAELVWYEDLIIEWTDGPNEQQVLAFTQKYKAKKFIIANATNPKFTAIKLKRIISQSTYEEAFKFAKNLWGMFHKIDNVNSSILFDDGSPTTVKKELFKYLQWMDLTNGIDYDGLELDYPSFLEKYRNFGKN